MKISHGLALENKLNQWNTNNNPCILLISVNGKYTPWKTWSTCSATCGTGTTNRTRTCTAPAPAFGGKPCEGKAIETKSCKVKECPGITCFVIGKICRSHDFY